MPSPTQRSLDYLRKIGWHVAVVEKWIPFAKIRKDVFGWGDILAVNPQESGAMLVQTTTAPNMSARQKKVFGNKDLIAWVTAGNFLTLHGWRKLNGRWIVSERKIKLKDLINPVEFQKKG